MQTSPAWKHFAAFIYDLFPVLGIFLLTTLVVVLVRNGEAVEQHTLWFNLLIFAELALYYIYSWKVGGQTLGMRAWKIKIIPNNSNQRTMTWAQASLRFLAGIVSTLLLGAGLIWKKFSKTKLSWMDMISNSNCQTVDD